MLNNREGSLLRTDDKFQSVIKKAATLVVAT